MSRSVVVDGVEIPEALLAEELQNHPGLSLADAREAAGKALAVKALLLARAAELGLRPDPEIDEAGREETPEEALLRAVMDLEVEAASPTEAECLRFYDSQPDRFTSADLYEASHILIEPRDDSPQAEAEARRLVERTARTLAGSPARFAQLARDLSACPSGGVGGSLGQLRRGDLAPEVETALLALEPGRISAPVRSRFGWHILRLDRFEPGRALPFEAVRASIGAYLGSRAWTAAAARYVNQLAATARAEGVAIVLTRDGTRRDGALMLGDFLADEVAAARVEPWLLATDADLARRLIAAAAEARSTPQQFVRNAAASFAEQADDERWTQLISAIRDAEDPALAALAQILRARLEPKAHVHTVFRRTAAK